MYKIPASTLFIGQNLVFVPECHSTNTLLLEMLPRPSEGTIVVTSNQTAGRGQRGNTWVVEPGKNLTFSLLLKPTFLKPIDQFFLTILCSLAVAETLTELEPKGNFSIKWPNDILADNKKICGMLIENSINQSSIQQSIAGIGLNINQQQFSVDTATSLKLVSGKEHDLNSILNLLLENLEKRYLQLRNEKHKELKAEYLKRMFGKDEMKNFLVEENKVKGIIRDVDDSGRLMVEIDGAVKSFNNKEISFIL